MGDQLGEFANADLPPRPEIDGVGPVVPLGRGDEAGGGVGDVQELTRRRPVPPRHDLVEATVDGVEVLHDQHRDDVAVRAKVVEGAVEVRRHQVDGVGTVLLPVRLRLDQKHLLGEAVRGVRLFGVAVPDVVLAEWHGSELRVAADGPAGDELAQAHAARMFKEVRAHHEVVVEEVAGMLAVGADAPHDGGEMDHDVRSVVGVEPRDAILKAQVVLRAAGNGDVAVAPRVQGGDNVPPEEPGATGDGDARVAQPIGRFTRQGHDVDGGVGRLVGHRGAFRVCGNRIAG